MIEGLKIGKHEVLFAGYYKDTSATTWHLRENGKMVVHEPVSSDIALSWIIDMTTEGVGVQR